MTYVPQDSEGVLDDEESSIDLNITLGQADALTKSIGKTLAAEMRKIDRHGRNSWIGQTAAKEWRRLDDIDNALREAMSNKLKETD